MCHLVSAMIMTTFSGLLFADAINDPTMPDKPVPIVQQHAEIAVQAGHRLSAIFKSSKGWSALIDGQRYQIMNKLSNGDQLIRIGRGFVILMDTTGAKHTVTLLNLKNR